MITSHILIVGGYYDTFLQLAARGFKISVILPQDRHYEILPDANAQYYFADVQDLEQCLAVAEQIHSITSLDIVMTHYELAIPTAARIAAKLGIKGPDLSPALKIRNKLVTREIANACADISTPFSEIGSEDEACQFVTRHGPSVLKPSAGVGGRDVCYVANSNDVSGYFSEIPIETERFQIEKFIDGREFSVEGFFENGSHRIIAITDKEQPVSPYFRETLHIQPMTGLSLRILDRVVEILQGFYEQVGYRFGATHSEFRLMPDGKLFLIEGHLRTGGLSIWEMTRACTGIDIFSYQAERHLGLASFILGKKKSIIAVCCGISCKAGKIKDIQIDTKHEDLVKPQYTIFRPAFAIGDEVPIVHHSRYIRLGGHVICFFKKGEEQVKILESAKSLARRFRYVQ